MDTKFPTKCLSAESNNTLREPWVMKNELHPRCKIGVTHENQFGVLCKLDTKASDDFFWFWKVFIMLST